MLNVLGNNTCFKKENNVIEVQQRNISPKEVMEINILHKRIIQLHLYVKHAILFSMLIILHIYNNPVNYPVQFYPVSRKCVINTHLIKWRGSRKSCALQDCRLRRYVRQKKKNSSVCTSFSIKLHLLFSSVQIPYYLHLSYWQ